MSNQTVFGAIRSITINELGHPSICVVREIMGLTGLEPVTLRLSSACSNQLSYRPRKFVPGSTAAKEYPLGAGSQAPSIKH